MQRVHPRSQLEALTESLKSLDTACIRKLPSASGYKKGSQRQTTFVGHRGATSAQESDNIPSLKSRRNGHVYKGHYLGRPPYEPFGDRFRYHSGSDVRSSKVERTGGSRIIRACPFAHRSFFRVRHSKSRITSAAPAG